MSTKKDSVMLCFAPMHNTKNRRDANEFQRQAAYFLDYHNQDMGMLVLVDNKQSKSRMRKTVYDAIEEYCGGQICSVHFFCHGYRKGIQFGFTTRNLELLARKIWAATSSAPIVTFYSCDVGRDADRNRQDDLQTIGGDGGFCDEFRDELCRVGAVNCRVDGHTTAGHTTRNPHVRRFNGAGSMTGGLGGFYLVSRGKKDLWKIWRQELTGDYRFEYPFQTENEIIDYLKSL